MADWKLGEISILRRTFWRGAFAVQDALRAAGYRRTTGEIWHKAQELGLSEDLEPTSYGTGVIKLPEVMR
jgi:hypothetical protein